MYQNSPYCLQNILCGWLLIMYIYTVRRIVFSVSHFPMCSGSFYTCKFVICNQAKKSPLSFLLQFGSFCFAYCKLRQKTNFDMLKFSLKQRPQNEALVNKPHKLYIYSPEPRSEVCCFRLNFNRSKLVNSSVPYNLKSNIWQ